MVTIYRMVFGVAKEICFCIFQAYFLIVIGMLALSSACGLAIHAYFGSRSVVEAAILSVLLSSVFLLLLRKWVLAPNNRSNGK